MVLSRPMVPSPDIHTAMVLVNMEEVVPLPVVPPPDIRATIVVYSIRVGNGCSWVGFCMLYKQVGPVFLVRTQWYDHATLCTKFKCAVVDNLLSR